MLRFSTREKTGLRFIIKQAFKKCPNDLLHLRLEDQMAILANATDNRPFFKTLRPSHIFEDTSDCRIYNTLVDFAFADKQYLPPAFCLTNYREHGPNAVNSVIDTIV